MEDDLNILKMEHDLNFLEIGRQSQVLNGIQPYFLNVRQMLESNATKINKK